MNNRHAFDQQRRLSPRGQHTRALRLALALLAVSGCDNVKLGGISFKVEEPGYERSQPPATVDTLTEPQPIPMPTGPILFHVRRSGLTEAAVMEPVAEVVSGELREVAPPSAEIAPEYVEKFNAAYYRRGQAYTLFRGAARVGSIYIDTASLMGSGICARLVARGRLELRPRADTLREFIAWPRDATAEGQRFESPESRPDMSTMAQVLVRRELESGERSWRIRGPAELRAIDVGTGQLGFAATFVVGDSLGGGSPGDSAGMAFIVADHSPAVGYSPLFFEAAWYAPGQKRVLRWIDQTNLIGDSDPEWLLRAFGDTNDWYEVVGMRDTARGVLWSSRRPLCEARAPGP